MAENRIADSGWDALVSSSTQTFKRIADTRAPVADDDATPVGPNVGDGLTALEEYRGFVVRGAHRRLDPGLKDLFVASDLGHARFADPALPVAVHVLYPTGELNAANVINFNRGSGIVGADQVGLRVRSVPGVFALQATQYNLQLGVPDCANSAVPIPFVCGDPPPPMFCGLLMEEASNDLFTNPNDSGVLNFFPDATACSYASITATDWTAAWDTLGHFDSNRQGHVIGHGVGMHHYGDDEFRCLMDRGLGMDINFKTKTSEVMSIVNQYDPGHLADVRIH